MQHFFSNGAEQREQVLPARYHELKALDYLAFGVQLILMANGSGRLTDVTAKNFTKSAHRFRRYSQSSTAPLCARRKHPQSCYVARACSSTEFSRKASSISTASRNTSTAWHHTRSRLHNWRCALSLNNCMCFSHYGAIMSASELGSVCTS